MTNLASEAMNARCGDYVCETVGFRGVSVRISVRLSFIVSERLIDATSILHYELEAPPV
jgi:hypothetical protein